MSGAKSPERSHRNGRTINLNVAIYALGVVSHRAKSVREYEDYLFGSGADPTPINRFDTSSYKCKLGFHASDVPVDSSRQHIAVRAVLDGVFADVGCEEETVDELCGDPAFQLLTSCMDQILADPSSADVLAQGPGMVALSTCSGTLSATLAALRYEMDGQTLRPHHKVSIDPLFLPAAVDAYLGRGMDRSQLSFCNTACSSSTEAIGRAATAVTSGAVSWAVAGGFDLVNEVLHAGFDVSKVLSNAPARPFNAQRSGFQLGEGAGLCLIAGAGGGGKPRPRIVGLGVGLDGYHLTAPEPTGRGLNLALRQAIGPRIADVAGIIGHGTGTPHNDAAEAGVYERLLEGCDRPVPLTSLKSKIGHTLGAAGVHGVAAATISLMRREMPGIRNLTDPIASAHVALSSTNQDLGDGPVVVSSSAFGGHNAALLLECDQDGT